MQGAWDKDSLKLKVVVKDSRKGGGQEQEDKRGLVAYPFEQGEVEEGVAARGDDRDDIIDIGGDNEVGGGVQGDGEELAGEDNECGD